MVWSSRMDAGLGRSMMRVEPAPGVRRATIALTILLVAVACGRATSESSRGGAGASAGCRSGNLPALDDERRELDGRSYLIDAPSALADEPLPLVLAFHGFRGSPDDLRRGTGL